MSASAIVFVMRRSKGLFCALLDIASPGLTQTGAARRAASLGRPIWLVLQGPKRTRMNLPRTTRIGSDRPAIPPPLRSAQRRSSREGAGERRARV
jgi:hypothetical protein